MNRSKNYTTVASIEDRTKEWRRAIDAAEKHIKFGQTLQSQGLQIIKKVKNFEKNSEAIDANKATSMIEKGIKIEMDSIDKIIDLKHHIPK